MHAEALGHDPDSDTKRHLPTLIQEARAQGALIHDLPPAATTLLAKHGLYTTTEPRNPGTSREFRKARERERALATIEERTRAMLGLTPEYSEAVREGRMAPVLRETFSSVTNVKAEDVHLAHPDLVDDEQAGIVTAKRMTLEVANKKNAQMLSVALQVMLSTSSSDFFYPVTMDTGSTDTAPTVTIGNLDEHAARALSRTLEAVIAQEDQKDGVVLPLEKRTHEDWKKSGETFPPHVEERLSATAIAYQELRAAATYRDRPDLKPLDARRNIGTDSAAVMEVMRDVMNGLIWPVRGGSHRNLEQHPIKEARPKVEQGIDLRRDKATLAGVQDGPPTSRAASSVEKGIVKKDEAIESARKKPLSTLTKFVAKALGAGAETALEMLPAATESGKRFAGDSREWKRRKEAAAAAGKKLDALALRLFMEERMDKVRAREERDQTGPPIRLDIHRGKTS